MSTRGLATGRQALKVGFGVLARGLIELIELNELIEFIELIFSRLRAASLLSECP